ncbi:hypothetical protein ACOME3_004955 [Neoechinorhynchus agilis]
MEDVASPAFLRFRLVEITPLRCIRSPTKSILIMLSPHGHTKVGQAAILQKCQKQSSRDLPMVQKAHKSLLGQLDERSRSRHMACSTESGAWLEAIPAEK